MKTILKQYQELENDGAKISKAEIDAIKLELASNLNTPIEILEKLHKDGNDKIKYEVEINIYLREIKNAIENKYKHQKDMFLRFFEKSLNFKKENNTPFLRKKYGGVK